MINTRPENLKQETSLFAGILIFMSSRNFMLSRVEHEKSFITSASACTTTYMQMSCEVTKHLFSLHRS